jgi:hypothetical protein
VVGSSENQVCTVTQCCFSTVYTHRRRLIVALQLSLLSTTSLERIYPDLKFGKEDMYDADFSEDGNLVSFNYKLDMWIKTLTSFLPTVPRRFGEQDQHMGN